MKKIIIVLAYTQADAEWACVYLKTHLEEKVYILTPTIEGQLILRKSGINEFLWYEIEEYEQQYLMDKKNLKKKGGEILQVLEYNFNLTLSPLSNINLISVLKDHLLAIYTDLLHSWGVYKRMINKWKPAKIYFPSTNRRCYITGEGDFFSLANYIQWYFKDSSRQYLTYSTISNKNRSFRDSALLKKLLLLKYLIQKWYLLIKNRSFIKSLFGKSIFGYNYPYSVANHSPLVTVSRWIQFLTLHGFRSNVNSSISKETFRIGSKKPADISRKRVLMETGGIITSYYYDFYKLVSRRFNFLLITYKLQLHQQIPLLQKSLPFVAFSSLWARGDNKVLNLVKKSLLGRLKNISNISLNRLIPRSDNKLQEALIDQTKLFIEKNIESTLRKLITNTKLLKSFSPDLVINSHDPSSTGLSLVLPAKVFKIPSILLLHGIPISKYDTPVGSNVIITWGEKTKFHFTKYSNLSKKAVFSSGFPLIDQYSKLYRAKRKEEKRAPNVCLGLLLTNYHPNDSYLSKFIFELIYSLRNTDEITVNFRLHEGYNLTGVVQLAEEYNVRVNDHTNKDLDSFIIYNDIFISLDTTAILWPMLYKKPLFYTSPIWKEGLLPLTRYRAAWIPRNAADLVSKVKEYMHKPSISRVLLKGQQKFLEDYAGPLDGMSSVRLFNIISKLVK